MQNASHKREKLEKKLREQLQSEIAKLKGGAGRKNSLGYNKDNLTDLQQKVAQLEADVAKVCRTIHKTCSPQYAQGMLTTIQ